jgi:hypothetical protein
VLDLLAVVLQVWMSRQPRLTWPALLASGVWPIRLFKCALTCHKSGRFTERDWYASSTFASTRLIEDVLGVLGGRPRRVAQVARTDVLSHRADPHTLLKIAARQPYRPHLPK